MKTQKIYFWYSALMWLLWISFFVLIEISGTAYDVKNLQLFYSVSTFSKIVNLISFIPVIPILWVFALSNSIKNKRWKYVVFNSVSILLTSGFWFVYWANHLISILGA